MNKIKRKIIAGILLGVTQIGFLTPTITVSANDYQAQLEQKNNELTELQNKKTNAEKILATYKTDVEKLKTELTNLESSISEHTTVTDEEKARLEQATEDYSAIQEEVDKREEFLQESGFIGKISESTSLTDLSKNITESVNGEDTELQKLEEELATAKEELSSTESVVSQNSEELNTLVTARIEKKEEISSKDAELTTKETEISTLDSEIAKKENEIDEVEQALTVSTTSSTTSTSVSGVATTGTFTAEYIAAANNSYNSYPWGQCTWGVKALLPWAGDYWGNANMWDESARAAGFTVDSTPRVGSIIVFNDGYYGHVAVVTAVSGSQVQILESNYGAGGAGSIIANYRGGFFYPGANVAYIHPKA